MSSGFSEKEKRIGSVRRRSRSQARPRDRDRTTGHGSQAGGPASKSKGTPNIPAATNSISDTETQASQKDFEMPLGPESFSRRAPKTTRPKFVFQDESDVADFLERELNKPDPKRKPHPFEKKPEPKTRPFQRPEPKTRPKPPKPKPTFPRYPAPVTPPAPTPAPVRPIPGGAFLRGLIPRILGPAGLIIPARDDHPPTIWDGPDHPRRRRREPCPKDVNRDSIDRKCGGRSAESKGPTAGYDTTYQFRQWLRNRR